MKGRGGSKRKRCITFALSVVTALCVMHLSSMLSPSPHFDSRAQSIRWCEDAVPGDFPPWLKDPWNLQRVRENGKAVIVIGTESSGSKLAALVVSRMLHLHYNRWRLNNDTNKQSLSVHQFWKEIEWGGHGSLGQHYNEWVVIHRSLPHGACFPRLQHLTQMLGPRGLGVPESRIALVVATRDRTTTLQSKLLQHQANSHIANTEQRLATELMGSWVQRQQPPTYVFSYESYMLLGLPYLHPLAHFLNLTDSAIHPAILDFKEYYEHHHESVPPTVDGNLKWHAAPTTWQLIHQWVDYLWNHRPAAYIRAHGAPAHMEVQPELRLHQDGEHRFVSDTTYRTLYQHLGSAWQTAAQAGWKPTSAPTMAPSHHSHALGTRG